MLTVGALLGAGVVIAVLVILGGGPAGLFASATATPGISLGPSPSISIEPYALPGQTKPPGLAQGRSLGPLDAPVQVDVWLDYQCPACRDFNEAMEANLIAYYIADGNVRLNVKDLATLGTESVDAAIGARCADRQGRFWDYHDLLYANQGPPNTGNFSADRLLQFAAVLGLNTGAFATCVADGDAANDVAAETNEGGRLPVPETPWLLVNGRNVQPVWDWAAISDAIDEALSATAP